MKTNLTQLLLTLFVSLAASAFGQVKQVEINTKVISVPLDAASLRDAGLSFDTSASASNLGIIPPEKAAAVIAKLEKMPGYSLLNVPSLTTKSGQRSTCQSLREFIYPTEFAPPKFSPQAGDKATMISQGQAISAAPTVPEAFEMRPIGFRLEIEPVINSDGTRIDMNIMPEMTTFEGFVNYGNPIKAAVLDKDGKLQEVVLTENQVLQPVVSTIKIVNSTSVPSGHVMVFAGASGGALPSATSKPDLKQEAKLEGKPTHAVFFFIQAKVSTP